MATSQARSDPPDENAGPGSIAIESVFASLAAVATLCRFIARRLTGVDLWRAVLNILRVSLWAFAGLHFAAIPYGLGRHVQYVSKPDQEEVTKLYFWYQICYVLAPLFVKISALFLYRRVFIQPTFERLVRFMLWLLVAWGVVSLLVSIFGCWPVQAFWTKQGTCMSNKAWVYGYGIINVILDFTVWLMPIPVTWRLQMSLKRRLALSFIFLLGLADCGVAIARLVFAKVTFGVADFTYEWTFSGRLGTIHPSLGIVVICLPTMRTLIMSIAVTLGLRYLFTPSEPARWDQNSSQTRKNDTTFYELRGTGTGTRTRTRGSVVTQEEGGKVHNNAIAVALRE